MRNHRGASISEYAIILALVVLVAIPAVMMMGNTFNDSYVNNDPTTQAQELYGLLDGNGGGQASAPIGDGSSTTSTAGRPAVPAGNGGYTQAYQPVTLEYSTMTTTSATGAIDEVSSVFDHIVSTGTMPDGTPLPDGFDLSKIANLAQKGYELGDIIEDRAKNPPMWEVLDPIINRTNTFQDEYGALTDYINQQYPNDPGASALLDELTDYSSAVKSASRAAMVDLTQKHWGAGFHDSEIDIEPALQTDTGVSGTLPELVEVVDENSTNIDNTQGQASQL